MYLGKMVKLIGIMLDAVKVGAEVEAFPDDVNSAVHDTSLLRMLRPPTSTTLRIAMISNISHSWKRSTMSAHVIWNRFSFSNFLNTVPLISTN
jgi:hypothetical protein